MMYLHYCKQSDTAAFRTEIRNELAGFRAQLTEIRTELRTTRKLAVKVNVLDF